MEISGSQALIDLFFLILLLRIIYIAVLKGVLRESFKVAGFLVGSLIAFQYYSIFADQVTRKISFLNKGSLCFISFLLILLSIQVVFMFLRVIVCCVHKKEEISLLERRLTFFVGTARAILTTSVVMFMMYLSPLDAKYFNESISYNAFKNIAPKVYLMSFGAYSNINKGVVLNEEVKEYYETKKSISRNNTKRY